MNYSWDIIFHLNCFCWLKQRQTDRDLRMSQINRNRLTAISSPCEFDIRRQKMSSKTQLVHRINAKERKSAPDRLIFQTKTAQLRTFSEENKIKLEINQRKRRKKEHMDLTWYQCCVIREFIIMIDTKCTDHDDIFLHSKGARSSIWCMWRYIYIRQWNSHSIIGPLWKKQVYNVVSACFLLRLFITVIIL